MILNVFVQFVNGVGEIKHFVELVVFVRVVAVIVGEFEVFQFSVFKVKEHSDFSQLVHGQEFCGSGLFGDGQLLVFKGFILDELFDFFEIPVGAGHGCGCRSWGRGGGSKSIAGLAVGMIPVMVV